MSGRKPSLSRMPRDAPGVSSMAPLRARARRWSSAALAERNPRARAISARVGGKPVSMICLRISSRTSCWRGVSFTVMTIRTVYLYSLDCRSYRGKNQAATGQGAWGQGLAGCCAARRSPATPESGHDGGDGFGNVVNVAAVQGGDTDAPGAHGVDAKFVTQAIDLFGRQA